MLFKTAIKLIQQIPRISQNPILRKTYSTKKSSQIGPIESKICIIGSNANSLYLSSLFLNNCPLSPYDLTVIGNEFESDFYFKFKFLPGFLYHGDNFQRHNITLFPKHIIKEEADVEEILPKENKVICKNGVIHSYEYLIIAPYLYPTYDFIPNLEELLKNEKKAVTSIYHHKYAVKHWEKLNDFETGNIIFYMNGDSKFQEHESISLALFEDENLRNRAKRYQDLYKMYLMTEHSNISSYNIGQINQQKILNSLSSRNLHLKVNTKIIEVKPDKNQIIFENSDSNEKLTVNYDVLHVMPKFTVPKFLKNSDLLDEKGLLSVNNSTLKHTKFQNIYCFGDCTNLPVGHNLSTLKAQAKVVINNVSNHVYYNDRHTIKEFDGKWNHNVYIGNKQMMKIPMIWNEMQNNENTINEYIPDLAKYLYTKYIQKPLHLSFVRRGIQTFSYFYSNYII